MHVENREALVELARQKSLGFDCPVKECFAAVRPENLFFSKLSDRFRFNRLKLFLNGIYRVLYPFCPAPGKGTVSLAGDAFHPSTPNLAQGGALALEVKPTILTEYERF